MEKDVNKFKSKSRPILLIFGFMILNFTVGCSRGAFHKPLDYTTTGENAWVIISCSNPQGQSQTIRHVIQIDDHEPLELIGKSQLPVLLSEGRHKIRFSSLGSLSQSKPYSGYSIFKDNFYIYGKMTEIQLDVQTGKRRQVKYVAPFWNYEPGTVRVLK